MKSFSLPQKIGLFFVSLLILGSFAFPYRGALSYFLWEATHCEYVAFLNPNDGRLEEQIAEYYFSSHAYDLERAQPHYEKTIALSPLAVKPRYQLGRIHFLNGELRQGLAEFDRVLELDPNFWRAYYMKGLTLGFMGELVKSAEVFEYYVAHNGNAWAGYNDLAWVYFQLGEYEKVRDISEKGLATDPENVWLLNMHGLALLNLGEKGKAEEYFAQAKEKADSMEPEDWGMAYPGNDPAIYADGLERMREAIGHNLGLVGDGS